MSEIYIVNHFYKIIDRDFPHNVRIHTDILTSFENTMSFIYRQYCYDWCIENMDEEEYDQTNEEEKINLYFEKHRDFEAYQIKVENIQSINANNLEDTIDHLLDQDTSVLRNFPDERLQDIDILLTKVKEAHSGNEHTGSDPRN